MNGLKSINDGELNENQDIKYEKRIKDLEDEISKIKAQLQYLTGFIEGQKVKK